MENRNNKLQAGIWIGFSCFMAVALAVNAVMAANGKAPLAWWHYGTLAFGMLMSWESLTAEERARIPLALANARRKAAKTVACILRAVGSLPALFMESYRKFQTEP